MEFSLTMPLAGRAYDVIASTLPKGSARWPMQRERGKCFIQVEAAVVEIEAKGTLGCGGGTCARPQGGEQLKIPSCAARLGFLRRVSCARTWPLPEFLE